MQQLSKPILVALAIVTMFSILTTLLTSSNVIVTGGRIEATNDSMVIATSLQNTGMLPRWVTLTITLIASDGVVAVGSESGWIPGEANVLVVIHIEQPNIGWNFDVIRIDVQ